MNYYNEIAKSYDSLHGEEQKKKLDIIKSCLEVNKNTKLLDVGCGTGVSSEFGCFVVGIDPSMGLLSLNNSKMKANAVAENLPFKSKSFDTVISLTAIQNFNDVKAALSEMKRVGKSEYVISILKKSSKLSQIKKKILCNFKITREIEEEKDIIYFLKKS